MQVSCQSNKCRGVNRLSCGSGVCMSHCDPILKCVAHGYELEVMFSSLQGPHTVGFGGVVS